MVQSSCESQSVTHTDALRAIAACNCTSALLNAHGKRGEASRPAPSSDHLTFKLRKGTDSPFRKVDGHVVCIKQGLGSGWAGGSFANSGFRCKGGAMEYMPLFAVILDTAGPAWTLHRRAAPSPLPVTDLTGFSMKALGCDMCTQI